MNVLLVRLQRVSLFWDPTGGPRKMFSSRGRQNIYENRHVHHGLPSRVFVPWVPTLRIAPNRHDRSTHEKEFPCSDPIVEQQCRRSQLPRDCLSVKKTRKVWARCGL